MKPARFAYARARSLTEVFDLLDEHGADARLLAGGQSLLPPLALRLSAPELLIDLGGLRELRFIDQEAGVVRIGALARHADVENSLIVAQRLPLLARAMPHIAHVAIRNRGTIGGSLSLADPAAELPACMLAQDAILVIAGRRGERRVAAQDFFKGMYETAIRPGELLVRVEIPPAAAGSKSHFAEFSRRHGDYAIVGLAAILAQPGPRPGGLRMVYFGCGDRPVRARRAEAAAAAVNTAAERRTALAAALKDDLEPQTDMHAGPETRLHMAAVLGERALAEFSA